MSAPAPGSAPTAVPSALPRRICTGYFFASAHWPLQHVADLLHHQFAPAALVSTTKRITSEMANMPIIIGIMPMPPVISALPKVKRGKPAGLPRPTQATSRPSSSVTRPLSGLVGGDEDGAGQAQQHQPEVLEGAEVERELGQRRRRHDQHRGAEQAAHRREHQAGAQRQSRPGPCASWRRPRRCRPPRPACRECAAGSRECRRRRSPWRWR